MWIPLAWGGSWGLEPRLIGGDSSRDVTRQGRDKAEIRCFSQPHGERGLRRDGQWDLAKAGREEGHLGALGQPAVV